MATCRQETARHSAMNVCAGLRCSICRSRKNHEANNCGRRKAFHGFMLWDCTRRCEFIRTDNELCANKFAPTKPASFEMNKPLIYGLLLSILMVSAPHADHLPPWVSALCITLLSWRAHLTYSGNPLPKRWLLMTVTFASVGGILISFHTLFGREVGVTLLILLTTLKFMELRSPRDAMVQLYLSCFIIITNFFYSQSIPVALYMLATLLVIVTTWVHLHGQNIALRPRARIAATL